MKHNPNIPDVLRSACWALNRVAENPENKVIAGEAGAVQVDFSALLHYPTHSPHPLLAIPLPHPPYLSPAPIPTPTHSSPATHTLTLPITPLLLLLRTPHSTHYPPPFTISLSLFLSFFSHLSQCPSHPSINFAVKTLLEL